MSTHASVTPTWEQEVIEYVREQQIEQYLLPMWQAVHEVFPNAREIRVSLETDPELRDVNSIVFTVEATDEDVPDAKSYAKKYDDWHRKALTICPTIHINHFVLLLRTSDDGSA